MATDSKPAENNSTNAQRALRGGAALLAVALLVGGLLLLVDFEKERPDFYESARIPLTEASRILSETYSEEKELMQSLQTVHSRLDHAIELFGQAEQLDPEDKRQIETLRVRIQALENSNELLETDPETLQRTYHELTKELNALANRLAKPKS